MFLLFAVACLAGLASTGIEDAAAQPPPPTGAYQPAPEAPKETHATDFVNELLKKRGAATRVTTPELRGGVVFEPRPDVTEGSGEQANPPPPAATPPPPPPAAPTPPPPPPATPGKAESAVRLPRPDVGPAERAGVASPVDQDVPGTLVGLAVGVILAAVGVVLEVTGRRRRRDIDAGLETAVRQPRQAPVALWRRGNPAAWAALGVLAVDAVLALAFGPQPAFAACALLVAPGLALTPFLPRELALPAVRFAIVPVLGGAASSIAIITVSALGIPLTGFSLRLMLLLIVLASLAASIAVGIGRDDGESRSVARRFPGEGATLAFLGAILCIGITLQSLILGGKPLPGQDWGHYLLYVDEIQTQNSLLIDNPYWMLGGRQFAEDPGITSLYGAYALLSGQDTAQLVQGIWLVAALSIVSVFVLVTALWGRAAGLIAAGLYAVVPMNLDMLAWHGLANVWALTLLPLVLLAAGMALRGHTGRHWAAFLALALVALAAAHRLTFLVAVLTLTVCLVIGLWKNARTALRFAAETAVFGAVLGAGMIVDLAIRNASTEGVQGYRAFLATKIDWESVDRDLTTLFGILGALALVAVLFARPLRGDTARFVLVALLGSVLALGYAWVVHFPMSYNRATYFLPLVLAAAIGVAATRLAPARLAAAGAAVVMLVVALSARDAAPSLRSFYGYVDRGSLTGLGYLKALGQPGDVVVTDTCWGFLATWLLREPILAAQDPALILPKAEAAPAATARRILYGGEPGRRLARQVGARYAIVDPQCTHQTGQPVAPPDIGKPIYASRRLVVLDLRRPATQRVRA